jgi:hemin uptake protein HemP
MSSAGDHPEPLPIPPRGLARGEPLPRATAAAADLARDGPPPAAGCQGDPPEISSETLLGGRSEIRIRHRGEVYRLSLTRAGKLILHK